MSFSIVLKELLYERNISQEKLAQSIGFSQRAVSKWVNAQAEPSESAIVACADFFAVSVDEIMGRAERYGNTTLTDNEAFLLTKFRDLDTATQKEVVQYISSLNSNK
ncbi:MAG: helix-turn-helix transcriptional regulator [Clostridia bacterium]|nr:helix-turn-helix transcriptional regulator [Clostridia bacterium]